MARDFIRPEIDDTTLNEFLGGRRVMINPSWDEVCGVIKQTQSRCKKNLLKENDLQQVWQAVMEQREDEAWAGEWSCPRRFTYGIQGTVFQMIRIEDGLVGLVCQRATVDPGFKSRPFISLWEKRENSPLNWLKQILPVFWMFLSDDEIEQLDRWALQKVLELAAERMAADEATRVSARQLRREQIESLFRGHRPKLVSEFQEAGRQIADKIEDQARSDISWNEIKKKWPSYATRFQKEFSVQLESNRISADQLRQLPNHSPFTVSFTCWTGTQRLFDQPQLVFRIRCPDIHREFRAKGGDYAEVSNALKKIARIHWHPGTELTVGWLRVHVDDDNQLCFVDEIQSDVLEFARKSDRSAAREFLRICADWNVHGFATIAQWAQDIGYRAASHSRESAQTKPGMTLSERKWNTYYRPVIKKFGLQSEAIEIYPAAIMVQPHIFGD